MVKIIIKNLLLILIVSTFINCSTTAFPEFKSIIEPRSRSKETRFLPLSIGIKNKTPTNISQDVQSIVVDTLEEEMRKHFEKVIIRDTTNLTSDTDYTLSFCIKSNSLSSQNMPISPLWEFFGTLARKNSVILSIDFTAETKDKKFLYGERYFSEKVIKWNSNARDNLDLEHKISYEAATLDIAESLISYLIEKIIIYEDTNKK